MTTVWEQSRLYRRLRGARHGVIVIVGTGQQGKTVAANSLVSIPPLMDRDVALVNYPLHFVRDRYPERYRAVRWPDDIRGIPEVVHHSRDVLIIDDAAWLVGARDHATKENRGIQKFVTIASHFEIFIITTIQNTSLMDIAMLQSQDVIMLHKRMDPKSMEFERPESVDEQVLANESIRKAVCRHPAVHPKSWTWCSTTNELLCMAPPPWWEPCMSKPYMGTIPGLDLDKRRKPKEGAADGDRRHDHHPDRPAEGHDGHPAEPPGTGR